MTSPSFTLKEWLIHRRISRSQFYVMQAAGTAPRTYRVGVNIYISPEADKAWLRQQEKAAKKAAVSA